MGSCSSTRWPVSSSRYLSLAGQQIVESEDRPGHGRLRSSDPELILDRRNDRILGGGEGHLNIEQHAEPNGRDRLVAVCRMLVADWCEIGAFDPGILCPHVDSARTRLAAAQTGEAVGNQRHPPHGLHRGDVLALVFVKGSPHLDIE